ncbi:hypothetical protein F5884DRAFT_57216 [Xylogone sp. PMI_703]|nr:hypothetical protein F5884DRAFT_57216 [Xylogone sp. PMI_703]
MILLAQTYSVAHEHLAGRLTVFGKDVIRYHEDDSDISDEEDEDKDGEDYDEQSARERQRSAPKQHKPIAIKNDESTPRYTECENFEAIFDVTSNETGTCKWHPGEKEVYEDEYFWADNDDHCDGDPWSVIDDPTYAEGFSYTCCGRRADLSPCKSTKHKATSNVIVPVEDISASTASSLSKKRKAEEELRRPVRSLWQ